MNSLKYMMGAYFHQDFDVDGGTSAHTVAAFSQERPQLVRACVDEIDSLLAEPLAPGDLEARLEEWGCDYYAGDTDQDYRNWLGEVRGQLAGHLTTLQDESGTQ